MKLTDFGIAKLLDAQGVTSTGQVLGSPAHMAPEQIEGGDVDGRADVFGLGVLLYECVVGHLPFLGNNPAQVLRRVLDGVYASAERERHIVGRRWSQIIARALARRPEDRYPDAATMRDAVGVELARLGMGSPRAELEAWLDDPEGWTAAHDASLIDRLCKLGAAEQRRRRSVGGSGGLQPRARVCAERSCALEARREHAARRSACADAEERRAALGPRRRRCSSRQRTSS